MKPDFEYYMDVRSQIEFDQERIDQYSRDRSEPNLIALYWNPEMKKFEDEDGYIVWNPEVLVPPWMIQLFKAQKSYFYGTLHGGNTIIELFWPEDDEEDYDSPPWNE